MKRKIIDFSQFISFIYNKQDHHYKKNNKDLIFEYFPLLFSFVDMSKIVQLSSYNILCPMRSDLSFQLSKYVKPWFLPNATLINFLALLYYTLPIRLQFYLGTVPIVLLALKFFGGYQLSALNLIDSNDCSLMLMEKLNIELIKLNWLMNKFTKECFQYTTIATVLFYLIDTYLLPSLSVWIAINLINLYLSFNKSARNLVKYHLGLYKQYNKYVIHIIQPNSQDQDQKEETFEEIFNELKEI